MLLNLQLKLKIPPLMTSTLVIEANSRKVHLIGPAILVFVPNSPSSLSSNYYLISASDNRRVCMIQFTILRLSSAELD